MTENTPDPEFVADGELVDADPDDVAERSGLEPGGLAGLDLGSVLGGLDLGSILGAAQDMQAQVLETQERLAAQVVEGHAANGAVKIAVNGGFQFQRVVIDPAVVDPADVELLEDLVLAALHDCSAQVEALQNRENPMGGIDLGGVGGVGGLGGLFGS